jgi:hypothetical protein
MFGETFRGLPLTTGPRSNGFSISLKGTSSRTGYFFPPMIMRLD